MTQIEQARAGTISPEMEAVARDEHLEAEQVREEVARGRMVIPANRVHVGEGLHPVGIGIACRTKINANLGNSPLASDSECELEKVRCAVKYGADTVMDLSTGTEIDAIRQRIIDATTVPVGTVPIYQMAEQLDDITDMRAQDFLDVVEHQASQGVDYMTVHCALLREHLPLVDNRLTGIVSRGGSLVAKWMVTHREQNPLYTHFDALCEIMRDYDVTWSLGDGLRPGSIHDASDEAQFAELDVMGELAQRAWKHNCQVMIEGPGHVPLDQIEANVVIEKRLCHGAPFYVLGPLVTDIAPGYDHITSAIGGAICAAAGADYLCYVTPAEHLGLPTVDDVIEGTIASRIAAHAADIVKGVPGAREHDDAMSKARHDLDWPTMERLALDPGRVRLRRGDRPTSDDKACSMCGKFCSVRARFADDDDASEDAAG